MGVWIVPDQVMGSAVSLGLKLTAVSAPLSGERKTRQVSNFLPWSNSFGIFWLGHLLNADWKTTGGSRVSSALTPLSGTSRPPRSVSPTFSTVTLT